MKEDISTKEISNVLANTTAVIVLAETVVEAMMRQSESEQIAYCIKAFKGLIESEKQKRALAWRDVFNGGAK